MTQTMTAIITRQRTTPEVTMLTIVTTATSGPETIKLYCTVR